MRKSNIIFYIFFGVFLISVGSVVVDFVMVNFQNKPGLSYVRFFYNLFGSSTPAPNLSKKQ